MRSAQQQADGRRNNSRWTDEEATSARFLTWSGCSAASSTTLRPHLPDLSRVLESRGRVALLARLKELGVTSLSERQKVANGLGCVLREGFDVINDPTDPTGESSTPSDQVNGFDPYMYAEEIVPAARALKGRMRRPQSMGKLEACLHQILGTPLLPPWPAATHSLAIFAAGCFWGLEKGFWRMPGVHTTAVGYSCGHTPHPTYSEVCTGLTGHTESVLVVYDPQRLTYADLLRWFWQCHDPTQGMGQGKDRGTAYRSAIVCVDEDQRALAEASKDAYQRAIASCGRTFTAKRSITTEVVPPAPFLPPSASAPMAMRAPPPSFFYAEEYHMQYLARPESSPYCTAQPLLISLPPFETWTPRELQGNEAHAPKLPKAFWAQHAPEEHCALRRPNEPINTDENGLYRSRALR
jgi:peptide-methionine (S)-S-oxide reductase